MLARRCTCSRRCNLGCRRRRHRGYHGNDAIAVARTTSTRRATDPQLDHDAPPFAERRFRQSLRVTHRGKRAKLQALHLAGDDFRRRYLGKSSMSPSAHRRGRGRHVQNSRIIGTGSILPETSVMHPHGGVQVAQRNRYVHPRCDLTPREAASSG
jgi:hypothetical protein